MNEQQEPTKYLIRNLYGWRCTRCMKVHEYLSRNCLPMLFNHPEDLMLVRRWREQVDDRTHDLNVDALPLGTIIAVTPREAQQIAARLAASGDGPPALTRTIFA